MRFLPFSTSCAVYAVAACIMLGMVTLNAAAQVMTPGAVFGNPAPLPTQAASSARVTPAPTPSAFPHAPQVGGVRGSTNAPAGSSLFDSLRDGLARLSGASSNHRASTSTSTSAPAFPPPPPSTAASNTPPVATTRCTMDLRANAIPRPVEGAIITSPVNLFRIVQGRRRPHLGTDFAAPQGTPIRAIANGRVTRRGPFSSFGNYLKIEHGGGYDSRYAHLHRFRRGLRPGDCVSQGEVVGYVGSTGASTGPHLHLEIRRNDKALLPQQLGLRWLRETD